MANDFDALAMQGEDTGVADPERHSITMHMVHDGSKPLISILTDEGKREIERGELVYYTAECACGWRGPRVRSQMAAWIAADEHVLGVA